MSTIPHLVGMVHLLPLPGSPGFGGSMGKVMERATSDSAALAAAGFPALLVENFGDIPFFADSVPPETVAAMTLAAEAVSSETGLPIGINVLRNDALSGLGIAAAAGAVFVRVNVLSGLMYTDQGPIIGRAAEVTRKREMLAPSVELWADVMVKHAAAPAGMDARQAASDTVERAGADAVIVSGSGTGFEPDIHEASVIRASIPEGTRVIIGSGATVDNLARLLGVANGMIVGSAIKVDGDASNPVDPIRAAQFAEAASEHGLL